MTPNCAPPTIRESVSKSPGSSRWRLRRSIVESWACDWAHHQIFHTPCPCKNHEKRCLPGLIIFLVCCVSSLESLQSCSCYRHEVLCGILHAFKGPFVCTACLVVPLLPSVCDYVEQFQRSIHACKSSIQSCMGFVQLLLSCLSLWEREDPNFLKGCRFCLECRQRCSCRLAITRVSSHWRDGG